MSNDELSSTLYKIEQDTALIDEIQDDMNTINDMVTTQENELAGGIAFTYEAYNYNIGLYDYFISKYNFNPNEVYTANKVAAEDYSRYKPYLAKISIETGTKLWTKLVELIKDLFNKIYNLIRMVYAKALTYIPLIESNITKLLGFLDANSTVPAKPIDRNKLRDVVNKAAAIFKANRDIREIESLLNPSTRLKLITSVALPAITYGNVAIKDIDTTNEKLTKSSEDIIESILKTSYFSPFEKYNNIVEKPEYDRYNTIVYRVDGRYIKYINYYADTKDSNLSLLDYEYKKEYVGYETENTLLLTKVYTPNDIKLILRSTLSYLGNTKVFQTEVSKMTKDLKELSDKLVVGSDVDNFGPTSGIKRLIVNNYYKLIKPVLSNIAVELIVGYIETAKDMYNMSYKFANLWYDKKYTITNEDDSRLGEYNKVSLEMYTGKGNTNKIKNDVFDAPGEFYDIEKNEKEQLINENGAPKDALGNIVEDPIKVENPTELQLTPIENNTEVGLESINIPLMKG